MSYIEFLRRKADHGVNHGFKPLFMPDFLFDFQEALVDWAVRHAIGIELKPTYFNQARKNLETVDEPVMEKPLLF